MLGPLCSRTQPRHQGKETLWTPSLRGSETRPGYVVDSPYLAKLPIMISTVEVDASENSPYSFMRGFDAREEPRPVSRVMALGPDGAENLYEVTSWSEAGPVPAYTALVEDSGDGTALLVYGGSEGVRLRPDDSSEKWSLDSPDQWGDAVLLLEM